MPFKNYNLANPLRRDGVLPSKLFEGLTCLEGSKYRAIPFEIPTLHGYPLNMRPLKKTHERARSSAV
jgi:hypothetical protein